MSNVSPSKLLHSASIRRFSQFVFKSSNWRLPCGGVVFLPWLWANKYWHFHNSELLTISTRMYKIRPNEDMLLRWAEHCIRSSTNAVHWVHRIKLSRHIFASTEHYTKQAIIAADYGKLLNVYFSGALIEGDWNTYFSCLCSIFVQFSSFWLSEFELGRFKHRTVLVY